MGRRLGLGSRRPGGSGFVRKICGTAILGPASGEARCFYRFREGPEQKADHLSDGGVLLSSKTAGLAVEVIRDGYGDVAYSFHI